MSIAIDVSAGNSRTIVKGIVGLGVAAAVCLVLSVLASGSVRATFLVLAVILLLVGGIPALKLRTLTRTRRFWFDPNGLRYEDPAGSWGCYWGELAGLAVLTSGHTVRNAQTNLPQVYGPYVSLLLVPATPDFLTRHPELAPHQDPSGQLTIPLGPNPELLPAFDQAARTYAPTIYRG
ncbi:hypothetical protein [Kribbella sp. NPDC004536]|uniref:hypothetical protein n=1 Tax=Kribbella sp. NPDC004536 TaxID=3364106 RepID=UPI0036A826C9